MQKIILKDKTEFEIVPGASINDITVILNNFTELENLTTALREKGNLGTVNFKQDGVVVGEYQELTLSSSTYFNVDVNEDEKVFASFSLREKTETEKQIETLSKRADVTEAALQEVILKQEV